VNYTHSVQAFISALLVAKCVTGERVPMLM